MIAQTFQCRFPGDLTAIKLNAAKLATNLKIPNTDPFQNPEQRRLNLLDGPINLKVQELKGLVTEINTHALPEVEIYFENRSSVKLNLSEVIRVIDSFSSNLDRVGYKQESHEFPCLQFHRAMFGLFGAATLLCKANEFEWTQFCNHQNSRRDCRELGPAEVKMPSRPLFILEDSLRNSLDELSKHCAELSKLLREFCNPSISSSFGRGLNIGLQAIGYIASFPSLTESDEQRVRLKLTSPSRAYNDGADAWRELLGLTVKKVEVKYIPGLLHEVEVIARN